MWCASATTPSTRSGFLRVARRSLRKTLCARHQGGRVASTRRVSLSHFCLSLVCRQYSIRYRETVRCVGDCPWRISVLSYSGIKGACHSRLPYNQRFVSYERKASSCTTVPSFPSAPSSRRACPTATRASTLAISPASSCRPTFTPASCATASVQVTCCS